MRGGTTGASRFPHRPSSRAEAKSAKMPFLMDRERRQFQRLPLDGVVDARLNEIAVRILELGVVGARLQHSEPLPDGSTLTLQFESDGEEVAMECVVIRSTRSLPGMFETGVRFSRA